MTKDKVVLIEILDCKSLLNSITISSLDISQDGCGVEHIVGGVENMVCGVQPGLPVQPPVKLEGEVESAGN